MQPKTFGRVSEASDVQPKTFGRVSEPSDVQPKTFGGVSEASEGLLRHGSMALILSAYSNHVSL